MRRPKAALLSRERRKPPPNGKRFLYVLRSSQASTHTSGGHVGSPPHILMPSLLPLEQTAGAAGGSTLPATTIWTSATPSHRSSPSPLPHPTYKLARALLCRSQAASSPNGAPDHGLNPAFSKPPLQPGCLPCSSVGASPGARHQPLCGAGRRGLASPSPLGATPASYYCTRHNAPFQIQLAVDASGQCTKLGRDLWLCVWRHLEAHGPHPGQAGKRQGLHSRRYVLFSLFPPLFLILLSIARIKWTPSCECAGLLVVGGLPCPSPRGSDGRRRVHAPYFFSSSPLVSDQSSCILMSVY